MATHNAISPELPADTLAETAVISKALRALTTCRVNSGVTRTLGIGRYAPKNRAWRPTIQVILPLAGPAFGFVALIAISLMQG